MTSLLMLFVDMCRLRGGPQDLPYSQFLMGLCIACYALVGLGVSLLDQSPGLALVSMAVDTILLLALAWLALWVRNNTSRMVQTVTALAGTGTLFGLIGWPIIAWLQSVGDETPSSLALMLLLLVVWNIAVIGNILRHALELPMWLGSGVALLYVYTSIRVMSVLHIAGTS